MHSEIQSGGWSVLLLKAGTMPVQGTQLAPEGVLPPMVEIPINALLLRGEGRTILVDAGSGPFVDLWPGATDELPDLLASLDADPGLVILTHFDTDHAGGVVARKGADELPLAFPGVRVIAPAAALAAARFDPPPYGAARTVVPALDRAGLIDGYEDGYEPAPGLRLRSARATGSAIRSSRSAHRSSSSPTSSIMPSRSSTSNGSTTGTKNGPLLSPPAVRSSKTSPIAPSRFFPAISSRPAGSSMTVTGCVGPGWPSRRCRSIVYLEGVRANSVVVGSVDTPLRRASMPSEYQPRPTCLAFEDDAWDIARDALFLASADAGHVTGVILPVDGGLTTVPPDAGIVVTTFECPHSPEFRTK